MTEKTFNKASWYFLAIVTIAVWALIFWDYTHGGVPSHHFLARADMPKVSNWWGGLLIPITTFFCLERLKNRFNSISALTSKLYILPFAASFLYAVALSTAFATDNAHISGYLFQAIFVLGLFFPIYRAEYFLGFILGLVFQFGGVLPVMIGLFLAGIGYVMYHFIRPLFVLVGSKLGLVKR